MSDHPLSYPIDRRPAEFAQFVRDHQARIRVYLSGFLKEQSVVDDVAQEVFLTAYRATDTFENRSQVLTWLIGIARHKALKFLRDDLRRRRREDASLETFLTTSMADDDTSDAQRDAACLDALHDCLEQLPTHSAELVRRYYSSRGGSVMTSVEHGISVGTLRMMVLRLRQGLRACIEKKLATQEAGA
jgi:RNA polymerase sigma-70 factor, ECF subfamily